MDNNMNYQEFIEKLGHSYLIPDMWKFYYILTNETLTQQELLDKVVLNCPGVANVLINGKNSEWLVAIPKPHELSETFPGQITSIKEEAV
jgi:hypothetical protein